MSRSARRTLTLTTLAIVVGLLLGSCSTTTGTGHPRLRVAGPVIGAWSLDQPREVHAAAAAGVNVVLTYTAPPTPQSEMGRALQQAGVGVIDARIGALARSFECHRTQTSHPPINGNPDFCDEDTDYTRQDLHDDAARIIREDKTNPLVIGLWTLDDTPVWDPGALRASLEDIHDQAQGLPTICGFAAHIGEDDTGKWDPRTAANFSDRACDYVAPYIYARPRQPDDDRRTIDWSMNAVLPDIQDDLRARGWDAQTTPLLGVGQSWGGKNPSTDLVLDQPDSTDMAAQAQAFCAAGAAGVAWYAWQVDQYPQARTPANDPGLLAGVAHSSAAVRQQCRDAT